LKRERSREGRYFSRGKGGVTKRGRTITDPKEKDLQSQNIFGKRKLPEGKKKREREFHDDRETWGGGGGEKQRTQLLKMWEKESNRKNVSTRENEKGILWNQKGRKRGCIVNWEGATTAKKKNFSCPTKKKRGRL